MKNILFFLLTTLMSFDGQTPIHHAKYTAIPLQQQPGNFTGFWKYQDGNRLFYVNIWQDGNNEFKGHYKMMTVDESGTVMTSLLYDSVGLINWPHAFSGTYTTGFARGSIIDNTVSNPRGYIDGVLTLTPINSCLGCPTVMQWRVTPNPGINSSDEPAFNIPTDITLTKFNGIIIQ